jgi:hypothetical protein
MRIAGDMKRKNCRKKLYFLTILGECTYHLFTLINCKTRKRRFLDDAQAQRLTPYPLLLKAISQDYNLQFTTKDMALDKKIFYNVSMFSGRSTLFSSSLVCYYEISLCNYQFKIVASKMQKIIE